MKTLEVVPVHVHFMPKEIEEGKIYISKEYSLAIHLCACGCKEQTVTPLGAGEWTLSENNDKVSLTPSILNRWCKAHYFIKNNKVEWA